MNLGLSCTDRVVLREKPLELSLFFSFTISLSLPFVLQILRSSQWQSTSNPTGKAHTWSIIEIHLKLGTQYSLNTFLHSLTLLIPFWLSLANATTFHPLYFSLLFLSCCQAEGNFNCNVKRSEIRAGNRYWWAIGVHTLISRTALFPSFILSWWSMDLFHFIHPFIQSALSTHSLSHSQSNIGPSYLCVICF